MQPKNQTDHIALLALMICGILTKRLNELGQINEATASLLHHLVTAVRTHAETRDLSDLHILFDNIERALKEK